MTASGPASKPGCASSGSTARRPGRRCFSGKRPFTELVLGPGEGEAAGAFRCNTLPSSAHCSASSGSLMIFRNTLQGMGYSLHAVLSGVGELLGRALGSALAVATPLGFCRRLPGKPAGLGAGAVLLHRHDHALFFAGGKSAGANFLSEPVAFLSKSGYNKPVPSRRAVSARGGAIALGFWEVNIPCS